MRSNHTRTGFLTWEEFLQSIKVLTTTDLNLKLSMFFQIIDADGNGMFDFNEIFEICKLSFAKDPLDEREDYRDELADYFATFIFEAFGKSVNEEIPLEDIKREVFDPESKHKVLLAMFCGAEQLMIPDMIRWREGNKDLKELVLTGFEKQVIE